MLARLTSVAAVGFVLFAGAPVARADPDPVAPADLASVQLPPEGSVAPAQPGFLETPDGWKLTVSGNDETLLPVPPLTTAVTSREYIVGGTFSGVAEGGGSTSLTGGTFEVGYRIGCGALLTHVDMIGAVGVAPAVTAGIPSVNFPTIAGTVRVLLQPGVVNIVSVNKKLFKRSGASVNISGFRIKIDGCAGQSSIQSYATLSSSTDNTEDVITYLGTVKVV